MSRSRADGTDNNHTIHRLTRIQGRYYAIGSSHIKKVTQAITVYAKPIAELRSVTCHIGSHTLPPDTGVTCVKKYARTQGAYTAA